MSAKSKGKRYTDKEKDQVLSYVAKVNSEKGRGGITAAAKKFKVTPLTISNWLKKTGAPRARAGRMPNANFASGLRRLADLHEVITKKEAELDKLIQEYDSLKKTL